MIAKQEQILLNLGEPQADFAKKPARQFTQLIPPDRPAFDSGRF